MHNQILHLLYDRCLAKILLFRGSTRLATVVAGGQGVKHDLKVVSEVGLLQGGCEFLG